MEELGEFLRRSTINHTVRNHHHQPSEEHLAFIPEILQDNVITLQGATLSRDFMKTVFIGITTTAYTPSMWDDDRGKWMNSFQLLQQNCVDVRMLELRESPGKVDCARAVVEINRALVILSNVTCGESIRVICLGPSMSQLILDTFTYLLREWKTPENEARSSDCKRVQVVTTGDGDQLNLFKLCKELCLSGVCQSIEFYDTMEYYPFGHYRKSYFFK
jgi:arginine repressor